MRQLLQPVSRRRHDLRPGQSLLAWLPAGARCRVVYGHAWITQDGDLADHFLRHGDSLVVATHGSVLIEALTQARIDIVGQRRRAPMLVAAAAAVRAGIDRMLRRLRSRLQFGGPRLGDPAF